MSRDKTHSSGTIVHVPHQPLAGYYRDEAGRQGFLRSIFDRTANDYDRVENLLSLGSGSWYRREALRRAGLLAGMRVLDVGVGTGLLAREAIRLAGEPCLLTGVDPSPGMMAQARLPEATSLILGRAESLPVRSGHFDFLCMGFALRHVGDLSAACSEFFRVLKPGGRICLLEISCPDSGMGRVFLKAYMKGLVPMLARMSGMGDETVRLWRYYWDTIDLCARPASILSTIEAAGFSGVQAHTENRALSFLTEYRATKPV